MSRKWFRVQSIGTVHRDGHTDPGAFLDPAAPSVLSVDDRWSEGLAGIEQFSHLVVLFYLDRAQRRRSPGRSMRPDGRDDIAPVGFFSTRTPKRPNPIGIACPRLIRRDGNDLHVTGIDAWDGTPIVDIKGYFPRDEMRGDAQIPAWLTELWRTHDEERTVIAPQLETRTLDFPAGSIVLREPHLGDVSAAMTYINALSAEQTFIMSQGEQVDEPIERSWVIGRMNLRGAGNGACLMAMHGDRVVGIANIDRSVLASRHVADLGLSVAADWRGVGLGRAMLNAIIDEARLALNGLRMVRLDVFANSEPAQRLYRSVGFVETGRTPGAILTRGEYVDSIQMVLNLA